MAFTNFCCLSGGSNLNAGTRTGDTTEPGTAADLTYASGNWVQATGVFTVASGDPSSDGVAVGDFASVYADGSTTTGFVGRVTARDATTITVSLTAKAGTAPTNGTGNRTLKIGGAWAGPSGTADFPFDFVAATLTNASADLPRVNLKNAATYSITAGIAHSTTGPVRFEGYTTSYGDGGRATIDGTIVGASYTLLQVTGANTELVSIIFANNGTTGAISAVTLFGVDMLLMSCVVHDCRGTGFDVTTNCLVIECEAYACNSGNNASKAGFDLNAAGITAVRCIAHDNTGSNTSGFRVGSATGISLHNCISDTNGAHGLITVNNSSTTIIGCDFYANAGDGINLANTGAAAVYIENCNLIDNTGYGINGSTAIARNGIVRNCGFGAGTAANGSGTTTGLSAMVVSGSVTYDDDVTPWNDPADGDFTITLADAKGAGRGTYTQTASSYTGTVAAPDIGAAQGDSTDAGGGGGGDTIIGTGRPVFPDSLVWEMG